MAVVGLGTDLVQIARFARLLAEGRRGVIDRLFTAEEKGYALAKRNPAPHLAARFAAKEAFLKAMGLGLRQGIRWQDMSVRRDELGAPRLELAGRAAELVQSRRISRVHLSYSHEREYGVATVVLEGPCDC